MGYIVSVTLFGDKICVPFVSKKYSVGLQYILCLHLLSLNVYYFGCKRFCRN